MALVGVAALTLTAGVVPTSLVEAFLSKETNLVASDGAAGDGYGGSVAVSGDRVVVGAQGDDDNGPLSGSVYVYEPDGSGGWAETKLIASDGGDDDLYGSAVAVSGDRIVVGARRDDDKGSVYVYEPDGSGGWTETKLTASDGAAGDYFGRSVAVSGDRVVVGAWGDDFRVQPVGTKPRLGEDAGSVYVYEPDGSGGWTETKLTASDAAARDHYGLSVAVSGDRVVVGARRDDDNASESGSVYVYEADGAAGWTETKLTASDAAANDFFGESVAVSGDRVVTGTRWAESVYVYEPDGSGGWTETKLTASDAVGVGSNGSVAVSGDRVVVGVPNYSANPLWSAAVYVYEPNRSGGWAETKLTASNGADDDRYASSVAVAGDRVVIGAPFLVDNSPESGSAYVHQAAYCAGEPVTQLGTNGPDVLTGTAGRDVIDAGGGDDTVNALGGNDVICLGPGNDTASSGGGSDTVYGGSGADTITTGSGADTVVAAAATT